MMEKIENREDGAGSGARAVLVGAGEPRHMEELGRLATTLGMEVVGVLEQGRRDNAGYVGRGKREELRELVEEVGADFVVTDDELTASQARVLERAAGSVVVDRTELIIRIFEVHAGDAASSLEVELADLQYRLPRVKGRNPELSRLGGGRGGSGGGARRGSGEQQLEYDRRVIRERIDTINRKLRREKTGREVRGARLREGTTPTVALVGYTNAGKTTVLNALSGAGRSTRDRLFETLETTTRLVEGTATGNGAEGAHPDFVVTDTVGFIRKLPTQLVHSFASTLEAANHAGVKVLCADASSDELEDEVTTAGRALAEGAGPEDGSEAAPTILCLNKMDLVPEGRAKELTRLYPEAVKISAPSDAGPLLDAIYEAISEDRERMEVLIPHDDYGAASRLYGLADIHSRRTTDEGLWMDVSLPRAASARYEPYRIA
ncbi:MAG: GTPase HflX [Rubrobacter sp.]|jgi:GTP-binding protein HflX|nr:GTPase HflX [Rubrobacter sp.]